MDKLQQLREALEQQRKYERENWPFLNEENKPTGTGASITYHLASLYCWSPGYLLTLEAQERDTYLQEIWRSFSIAGDIIKRYEDATEALLKQESQGRQGECVECGRASILLDASGYCKGCVMQAIIDAQDED